MSIWCCPVQPFQMRYFAVHFNRKSCCLCAFHNSEMDIMDASTPDPFGVVLCNPFKWDILLFILIENHVVCVPSTTAKWISFCNHKNRKVVGGKHNVLVHYLDAVHPTHPVLSSTTLSNEIFCIHFWLKIMLLFLCLPQKQNEFYSSTTGMKSCRRHIQWCLKEELMVY